MKILILNGPNINLIGMREKKFYGNISYEEINKIIIDESKRLNIDVEIYQSNIEGELITKIQKSLDKDFLILNLGAYTHTSIAIRDALLAVNIPKIEVHLSNIFARENFRKKSFISDIVEGVISGFGYYSYILALQAAKEIYEKI